MGVKKGVAVNGIQARDEFVGNHSRDPSFPMRDNIEIIEQKKNSKNASDANNSKIHQKHFNSKELLWIFFLKIK